MNSRPGRATRPDGGNILGAARRGPATSVARASGAVGRDDDELRVFSRLVVHGRREPLAGNRPLASHGCRLSAPSKRRDVVRDVGSCRTRFPRTGSVVNDVCPRRTASIFPMACTTGATDEKRGGRRPLILTGSARNALSGAAARDRSAALRSAKERLGRTSRRPFVNPAGRARPWRLRKTGVTVRGARPPSSTVDRPGGEDAGAGGGTLTLRFGAGFCCFDGVTLPVANPVLNT